MQKKDYSDSQENDQQKLKKYSQPKLVDHGQVAEVITLLGAGTDGIAPGTL